MNLRFVVTTLTFFSLCAILPTSASAVEKCKIKVDKKTGVILFSASGIAGPLTWGTDEGDETRSFADPLCITGDTAKGCTLADPTTLAAKTPPSSCTLYVTDGTTPCQVFVRGCFPQEDIRVRATSIGQVLTNGVNVPLPFDFERWDTADIHDNAVNNTNFVVPSNGVYSMSAHLRMTPVAGANAIACITLNGTSIDQAIACSTTGGSTFLSIVSVGTNSYLQAGDVVRVTVLSGEPALSVFSNDLPEQYEYDFSMVKTR